MPIPTISPLPTPPSRTDTGNFAARADAFLGAFPTLQAEINAAGAAMNAVYFPPGLRNAILNGDFAIWQRATSQTSSGYGSDDRWTNGNLGSTKVASRQAFALGQTDVAGNPEYFARTVVTSVAGAGNFVAKQQRIEGVRRFSGRSVRVSFDARADAARPIAIDFAQSFGTGGSPSASVTAIGAQKFSLATAWQRFAATVAIPSVAGKTLGTAGNDHLEFTFWLDAGSSYNARSASLGQQSGTFDIANVQIEEGTEDTPFEIRPPGLELALCRRYHLRLPDALRYLTLPGSASNDRLLWESFPTTMRVAPTVANIVGSGSPTASAVTPEGIRWAASPGNTTAIAYVASYTADAEL